jgi:flavin reductase (DIM6/NTAB) family NADH-FMN oxidoreductase RutF
MPTAPHIGMTAEASAHDQHRALRDTLSRYATGVAVVTAAHNGRRSGITINSFTSLSLAPALVLWCLRRDSPSLAGFTAASHHAVNVLAADQVELAYQFALPGDRFRGVALLQSPWETPLLAGTVATIVCRLERIVSGGDHVIVIGHVVDHQASPGPSLLFHDGAFPSTPSRSHRTVEPV